MLRNPSRLRHVTNIDQEQAEELTDASDYIPVTIEVGSQESYRLGSELWACAEIVRNKNSSEIFGDGGLLAELYQVSQDKLSHSVDNKEEPNVQQSWLLECRTWDLVQRLYIERTKEHALYEVEDQSLTNHELVQQLYDTDIESAEAKVVLDWLHDSDYNETPLETRSNGWFYTREHIKSRQRTGKSIDSDEIVNALDPDAPVRQGKQLAEEDSLYERNLVKAMFVKIRIGDYSGAADIARVSGSHWRAASLRGCVERHDPVVNGSIDVENTEGSFNKPLWRRMCFALSQQSSFDVYERALYGAICGDIASVVPVLHTWEDLLWVKYNAMNQSMTESHLRKLGRVHLEHEFPLPEFSFLNPRSILDSLFQGEQPSIREEARMPLRVVQARLITNQSNELLGDVYGQLQSVRAGGRPTAGSSPHLIRFVSHLILVLRQLQVDVPEEACNAIIQAYVEILASAKQQEAIAVYASQLPMDQAIESFARFLTTVDDEDTRRNQLRLAREHSIDVRLALLRTIELVFEEILSELPLGVGLGMIDAEMSSEEEKCIRALEWSLLDDSLQHETVVLGNTLFRKFLLSGRLSAARTLGSRMPDSMLIAPEIMSEDHLEDSAIEEARMRSAIEYIGYCTLVTALTRYHEWKTLTRGQSNDNNGRRDPVGLRQRKSDLERLKYESIVSLREILSGNWCDPSELGMIESEATEEMLNLRNMYIPEVILSLHGIYAAQDGRDVASAMDLAVLVAERFTVPMKQSGNLQTYVTELSFVGSYLV